MGDIRVCVCACAHAFAGAHWSHMRACACLRKSEDKLSSCSHILSTLFVWDRVSHRPGICQAGVAFRLGAPGICQSLLPWPWDDKLIWNASQICVSPFAQGPYANLLCGFPILVYVLPKWVPGFFFNMGSGHWTQLPVKQALGWLD